MPTRTYRGDGRRTWIDGVLFPKGEPVTVSADIARQCDSRGGFQKSEPKKKDD